MESCQCKIVNAGRVLLSGLCSATRPVLEIEEIEAEDGWMLGQQKWQPMVLAFTFADSGFDFNAWVQQYPTYDCQLECFLKYGNESWDMSCKIKRIAWGDIDFSNSDPTMFEITIEPIAVGREWH